MGASTIVAGCVHESGTHFPHLLTASDTAQSTSVFSDHSIDLEPVPEQLSGCPTLVGVQRCIQLRFTRALDATTVSSNGLRVWISEGSDRDTPPIELPYDAIFSAPPVAVNSLDNASIRRSFQTPTIERKLYNSLVLPLRSHSELLAVLRRSMPQWQTLDDQKLAMRSPTIRVEVNGVHGTGEHKTIPWPKCDPYTSEPCSIWVFATPLVGVERWHFNGEGISVFSEGALNHRPTTGGVGAEFVYDSECGDPPTYRYWTLRESAQREWNDESGNLEQTQCVDGLTPTSLCRDGKVWTHPLHEPISGEFVQAPAQLAMVAHTALGWAYTLDNIAPALQARGRARDSDEPFEEHPASVSFAFEPADSVNGFTLGMPVFRLEVVNSDTFRELREHRQSLRPVTQSGFGDAMRRDPRDINAFQFSPVGIVGASLVVHRGRHPDPTVTVRVHPLALRAVNEVELTDGRSCWRAHSLRERPGFFRAVLNGTATGRTEVGFRLRVNAYNHQARTRSLVGFDSVATEYRSDEPDRDRDSIADDADNCPERPNTDQLNLDNDPYGDVCDDDIDGDYVSNEDEISRGRDPRSPDSDGDGLDDSTERKRGSDPENADSDSDDIEDPLDSLTADDDCDGIVNAEDDMNLGIGRALVPLGFRSYRRSVFHLTLLERVRQRDGTAQSVPHDIVATVEGATSWWPIGRAEIWARGYDLELQPFTLIARPPLHFESYFVASRSIGEFLDSNEARTISTLQVTWTNPTSQQSWHDENGESVRVRPEWVVRGCVGDDPTKYFIVTPERLREQRIQRCIASSLRGVAGFVTTEQAQGESLCGLRPSSYTRMLKINDWNGNVQGFDTPGVPRVTLCESQSRAGSRNSAPFECVPAYGFRNEHCGQSETSNESQCGAGITLTSIVRAYAEESIRDQTQTVPSLNTQVAADDRSLWNPDPYTIFSRPPTPGIHDDAQAALTGGTEIAVHHDGNWVNAIRVAVQPNSHSTETWWPYGMSDELWPLNRRSPPRQSPQGSASSKQTTTTAPRRSTARHQRSP